MSIQMEVDRFRSYLASVGYDYNHVHSICDDLTQALNESVFDIVTSAVDEALDYAIDVGADSFVEDVQVIPDGNGYYSISSRSGTLDYSSESIQMLQHLLKNAKVGADGSRYKVIPVKGARTEASMFSMLQTRQDKMDKTREVVRNKAKERRADITSSLQQYAGSASSANSASKAAAPENASPNFRTASDKQDASVSWVLPEKDADMTSYIHELNSRIVLMSEQMVSEIVDSFYQGLRG